MEIIELTAEARAEFVEALKPVLDAWIEEYEGKGIPARELIADIHRLNAKYENMTPEELFELTVKNPVPGLVSGM